MHLIKPMPIKTTKHDSMNTEDIYKLQGFGQTSGIGQRCGLLLVDFVNSFVDSRQLGGPAIQSAVDSTVPLLAAFRKWCFPIAHTRVVFEADGSDRNVFSSRVKALQGLTEHAVGSQIVQALKPQPPELVIRKQGASAFFNTPLADWLRLHAVDTLVVTGCTTSGCVRATVVDAVQHNFRTVVVSDCVGDRAAEPHDANLFDMGQKYADIMRRDDLLKHLQTLQGAPT
jgi:maleamate amidohydrolase